MLSVFGSRVLAQGVGGYCGNGVFFFFPLQFVFPYGTVMHSRERAMVGAINGVSKRVNLEGLRVGIPVDHGGVLDEGFQGPYLCASGGIYLGTWE